MRLALEGKIRQPSPSKNIFKAGLYRDYIRVILGVYWGYIGVILGFYKDNRKENGNYYSEGFGGV